MKSRKPSIPYIIWMVVFTMIPIIMIGFTAFTDKNGNFSLQAFTNAFYYTNIFVKSLWIALISTAICLVLAYPLAYLLTRMKESTQNTLIMLLMIPMWMNFLLRIYAWVTLLQDNGPIDMMLSLLGIHSTYIGNTGAVILGSNNFTVFRKVVAPLSVPGIISGVTMVFVPSASTFLVAQYLGGPDDIMIGDVIEKIFWTDQNTGSAISLILMIFIFVFLIIMNLFGDEEAIA